MSIIPKTPVSNRRAFLTRALAGAAGTTIAASAGHAAGAESILALGRDPVAVLGDEWDSLNVWHTNCPDSVSNEVGKQVDALEDRIAEMIPSSAAGALVLILLMRQTSDWGGWHDKLADNLIAGLRALAAGGAA